MAKNVTWYSARANIYGVGGGCLEMYVVHAARVQLTFSDPLPGRKKHVLDPRGGVQLTFVYPSLPPP